MPEPHRVIARIPFSGIVTTNFDKLLERVFPEQDVPLVLTHADKQELGLLRYNGKPYVLKVALADDWRVTAFPYDWRLDADTIADQLAMTIERVIEDAGSCHIVAHGFGGLVVRALMHRSSHLAQRLDHLVLLGTPNHGTVSAVQDLAGAGAFMKILATGKTDRLTPGLANSNADAGLVAEPEATAMNRAARRSGSGRARARRS